MAIQQITAEIGWHIITSLGIIIAISGQIAGWVRISNLNKQKYATKEEVKEKINHMEQKIQQIQAYSETHRKENIDAHKEIKNEMIKELDTRFESIKTRFDDLFKLLERIGKAS